MRFIKAIVVLLVVGLLFLFAHQNNEILFTNIQFRLEEPLLLKLSLHSMELPLAVIMAVTFALGGLIGVLFTFGAVLEKIRMGSQLRAANSKVANLEAEVEALKAQASKPSYASSYAPVTTPAAGSTEEESSGQ